MAFDIGYDDEVITTPYSFFASTSSITRLGGVPIFVDIDPQTYNLDVSQIEEKITEKNESDSAGSSLRAVCGYGRFAANQP